MPGPPRWTPLCDGRGDQIQRSDVDEVAHHLVGNTPVVLNPPAQQPREFGDRATQTLDPLGVRRHRLEIGFGEIAVVLGGFLAPARRGVAVLVEVSGFLRDVTT